MIYAAYCVGAVRASTVISLSLSLSEAIFPRRCPDVSGHRTACLQTLIRSYNYTVRQKKGANFLLCASLLTDEFFHVY